MKKRNPDFALSPEFRAALRAAREAKPVPIYEVSEFRRLLHEGEAEEAEFAAIQKQIQ